VAVTFARRAAAGGVAGPGLWLLASAGCTAVLGAAAWAVVARTVPATQVGAAAAAIAALSWVAVALTAGVAPTLTATLPAAPLPERRSLVGAAFTATVAALVMLGVPAVGVAVWSGVPALVAFAGWMLVAATALGLLFDAVLVGVGRTPAVFARMVTAGLVRVAFAVVAVSAGASVLTAWVFAAAAGAGVAAVAATRVKVSPRFVDPRPVLAGLRSRVGWNQLATLSAQLPAAVLPFLVATIAGAEAAAGFYFAWLLASGCAMVPAAVSPALLAAAARPGSAPAAVAAAVRFTSMLLVPVAVGTVLVGPTVLGFAGDSYRGSYVLLLILVAGAPFDAATALAASVWRATGRERAAAMLNTAMAVTAVIVAAVAVPVFGVVAAVAAFVAAQIAGTVVVVVRARRR
jgi:O-antigen/teichoic acid export membrane protein